ncbi:MAG: iron-containing alcohol dehydrogenase [Planctomycetota bacterium]|jgi:alcohol dehydrogenase class IV
MRFEFATAARIIFGEGAVSEVAPLAAEMGDRAFVVTGSTTGRAEMLLEDLNECKIKCVTFSFSGEPTAAIAKAAVKQAREAESNLVISIGGGSVLDTGKVVAAMLTNSGQLEDYVEVVGDSKPLTQCPIPNIAIPTTAGTGAEVTRNAVLGLPEYGVKVSMRSDLMLPRLAVVDPVLSYSMPPTVTASTGLDALTQLIEAYVSQKANALTDGICLEGLRRAGRSLQQAYEDGGNRAAREDISIASLFGGLALANAKLGAVHGLSGVLGGMISAGHGVICGGLLPHIMQANVQALQKRAADSAAFIRYDEIARVLTGAASAYAVDGLRWVQEVCRRFKLPSLSEFGLKEKDFYTIIAKCRKSSSMKGNPIVLTDDELMEILRKSR